VDALGLAFRAFFGGCALVMLAAWVLLWRLPEIPLRVHAAREAHTDPSLPPR
jgi:hypothetical protein